MSADKQVLRGTSLQGGDIRRPRTCGREDAKGSPGPGRCSTMMMSYDPKGFNAWKLEVRGKTLEPPLRPPLGPLSLAYKKRVYSKNRVRHPLKRVDWDPAGAPGSTGPGGRNTQNRGRSKYVRISWDEAAQLVASELTRVGRTYGPEAVLSQADMHGETKHLSPCHACANRLLSLLGGYTVQIRNLDSWEGWNWGAKHVWGCEPVGEMMPWANVFEDIAKHGELLLFWGCDPETTPHPISGMFASRLCYWLTDVGLKSVYVCPDLNYGAAVHADKWIPILPNTDAALQLAIAHLWLTEGTYDDDYVATHTYGFDRFAAYVLGETDGVPKTPAWAAEKCGIPVWTIKALARDWARKATSLIHGNGGPGIRGIYSTEPARLEVMLLGMQGLGKPGRHQTKMIEWNMWRRWMPLPYQGKVIPQLPHFAESQRPAGSMDIKELIPPPYQGDDAEMGSLVKLSGTPPQQAIPKCRRSPPPANPLWGLPRFSNRLQSSLTNTTTPRRGVRGPHDRTDRAGSHAGMNDHWRCGSRP